MDRIINFEKFKDQCSKYDKPTLKALLWNWAMQRILHELVLVNAIMNCKENGDSISKAENLADLDNTVKGEQTLINLLGRKEAAKVYGLMEDITSDVRTVDYVLAYDAVKYYGELATSTQQESKEKEP